MRTKRNLTMMDVEIGTFESAEQRRKVFFRSKKKSPRIEAKYGQESVDWK